VRLLFLGTGAAEAYPALFCECANCEKARSLGGRNLRLRSALLINEDLLLDAGPDLTASAMRYGLRLSRVRILLFTHSHNDHFNPHNLIWRASENRSTPLPLMKVFGPPNIIKILSDFPDLDLADACVSLAAVTPYSTWCERGYCFHSYPARHGKREMGSMFYSVDDGHHHVLYATDTGPWGEEVWRAISKYRFSVVILDETMGNAPSGGGHHNLISFPETYHRFQELGLLVDGALFIAHHISHDNPPHDQLVEILGPEGITVAYDGLEITL